MVVIQAVEPHPTNLELESLKNFQQGNLNGLTVQGEPVLQQPEVGSSSREDRWMAESQQGCEICAEGGNVGLRCASHTGVQLTPQLVHGCLQGGDESAIH